MIKITDIARDKMKEILEKNSGKYVRMYLEGAG